MSAVSSSRLAGPPTRESARVSPGRPPDPDLERRIFAATLDVYAELGWSAFTVDAVAKQGKVGKVSIYRRWPTKQELLVAALESSFPDAELSRELTGSFRDQLLDMATQLTERYLSRHGLAQIRAQLEAKVFPDVVGVALAATRRRTADAARDLVNAAIERGEIPAGTSSMLVLDAIVGTLVQRILLLTPERHEALAADPSKFVERVVDLVLDGAYSREGGT